MEKFCDKHVNLAKERYYKKFFNEHKENSKKQWEMISSLLNRKPRRSGPIKLKDSNGNISNTSTDVAEKFNEYFSNIASNVKAHISSRTTFDPGGFQDTLGSPAPSRIYLRKVEPSEVHEIVKKFKNKATLDTKIEPLKIANGSYSFTSALAKIINNSFEQGIFPQHLKLARVIPVHKGGSRTDVTNYRPISLLSAFSKVYEKLMHSRALEFLDPHGDVCGSQLGVRAGRS